MSETCQRCNGSGWVCESHPDKPMEHLVDGIECGGAGDPCPDCNELARPPKGREQIEQAIADVLKTGCPDE